MDQQATRASLAGEPAARTIGGRYRLVRRLASGGMATVYEAIDERTERTRALKLLQPALVSSEVHRKRFIREATVTARFSSDNVVDILDAGIDEPSGSPFLVMPLLAGRDLAAELDESGSLEPAVVVAYLTQVARALDRAHQAQIVHRDLKPANVFIAERDDGSKQALVLDFGIAKLVDRVSTRATEAILGSPLYLAPEQVRYKKERVTERADVYALGQLAYTSLVGEAYYAPEDEASDGVMGLLMEMAVGETQPASERARERRSVELPAAFDPWFARATARDPADRFRSASEAVSALARVFDLPEPTFRAEPPPRTEPADATDAAHLDADFDERPPVARRRLPFAIGIGMGAVGLSAILLLTIGNKSSDAGEPTPADIEEPGGRAGPDPEVPSTEAPSPPPGPREVSASAPPVEEDLGRPAPVGSSTTVAAAQPAAAQAAAAQPAGAPRNDAPGTKPSARGAAAATSAPPEVAPPPATGYTPPVTER
jgi:serine/threonine-protein kinase